MDPNIFAGLIIAAPVAALTLLRANAATAFLALCLGSVLGTYVSLDLVDALRGYIAPPTEVTNVIAGLVLLWGPVLLVAIFMMKTVAKKQIWLNIIPAVFVGLFGLLLTVPFLDGATKSEIVRSDVWRMVEGHKALIVGVGTLCSFLFLRMRKKADDSKGKTPLTFFVK